MSKLRTTNYKGWDGKIRWGDDPSDHGVDTKIVDDTLTVSMSMNDTKWMPLGVSPLPKTRWDWFWFDYHHGRLMRYPWLAVMRFCITQAWGYPHSNWRNGTDQ